MRLPNPRRAIAVLATVISVVAVGCGGDPGATGTAMEREVVREVVVTPETPPGRELAQHAHDGEWYTLVEYDEKLAVFSASGSPLTDPGLAGEVLRSYAWGVELGDLELGSMSAAVEAVRDIDHRLSGVRETSNEMVFVFDFLEELRAEVPLRGTVSAMDVLAEIYPGLGIAAGAIRLLDSELNFVGRETALLASSLERIKATDPSTASWSDIESLFGNAAAASREMESRARSVEGGVAEVLVLAQDLEDALWQASDTPLIGEAIAEAAATAGEFNASFSGLTDLLQDYADNLRSLAGQFKAPIDGANEAHRGLVARWLQVPYDENWRSATRSRPVSDSRQAVATARPTPTAAQSGTSAADRPTPVPAESRAGATAQPAPSPTTPSVPTGEAFRLDWETSATSVNAGESFTLTVRMYDVQEAGEHGGISVSFPTLTESGGSTNGHSSFRAEVEVLDYTSGLSNVTFHQPGATIYHRENNRQFPAAYLLVESDDPSWSRSDDRTLRLRITPWKGGEFPMQIRGWLCADGYTGCYRNPSSGPVIDQQGWVAEKVWVNFIANRLWRVSTTYVYAVLLGAWSVSFDEREYELYLEEGARFQSGRAIKAWDVGYSLEIMHETWWSAPAFEIHIIDDLTLKVMFEVPYADFAQDLAADPRAVIVPQGNP